ncbi:MAG: homoserine dehydrogenase [Bacillota bacterium]
MSTNTCKARKINVGIFGLGTIGGGTATAIINNADIISARSMDIDLVRVADKNIERAQKFLADLGAEDIIITDDWHDLVNDPNIDIMVEVAGGIDMPLKAITAALKAGKSVVTANKDLMATHGGELLAIAEENNVDLFFEASVAGAIPIILPLKESMACNKFQQIMGILNGTTNYILTSMSETGSTFEAALEEAKALGYAEADPTNDVEGYDAARKVAILASIAFNSRVTYEMVYVEGITKITDWDIAYAKEFGYTIKILGIAKEDNGLIEARVHPVMIPLSHPLAAVRDSFNAIFVEAYPLDQAMFYGRGAGALPTASAVVGDMIAAARNIVNDCKNRWSCGCFDNKKVKPIEDTISKYYVRINAYDKPGVFAAITDILGKENVSLDSVMQKRRLPEDQAEIVMITDKVKHSDMMGALDKIAELDCVAKITNIIRVADE